jgi:prepilin-type processing-associated H-X9-DG protein
MYKVILPDQKEYGPVTADQLRQWIAEGRVNAQASVMAEGATEWKPLSAFPEFASSLPGATAAGGVPRPVTPGALRPIPKTSGMAIASLVLGILGLFSCGVTALVGLILGIISMNKIRQSRGALSGNGIALAGTIVSGIFLLMLPIFAAMLLPALASAKQKAQSIACLNNMKQLSLSVRLYSNDNNNHFPPAATWCDALLPYAGGSTKLFQCPAGDGSKRCDYAYNAKLGSMAENNINPETVVFFETDGGWNVSGGRELMLTQPRHRNVFVVAFADGHVEQVPASGLAALRWTP